MTRTACSPPTGCHRCGGELKGRRTAYCSDACRDDHWANHDWNSARRAALKRVLESGIEPYAPFWRCEGGGPHGGHPQVHHKTPLWDAIEYSKMSCAHHQDGLSVLCKRCHTEVHKTLRRAQAQGVALPTAITRRLEKVTQGVLL